MGEAHVSNCNPLNSNAQSPCKARYSSTRNPSYPQASLEVDTEESQEPRRAVQV